MIESLLARIGIEPTTISAAGVADQSVSSLVTDACDWCAESGAAMAADDQRRSETSQTLVVILRSLRRGESLYSQQDLSAARTAFDEADAEVNQRLSSFLQTVTAGWGPDALASIHRVHGNQAWHVDTAYAAVSLNEDQWLSLKNALRCGENAPPEDMATLASVRSDMNYTLADANLSSTLSGVRSAWETAWTGQ